ncbi:MAG: hypothetical protein V7K71_31325 [Nostoc sp.]|uniref:hypothetical protein n=1 Tax=Nostoc sp. TaxID=1180 RepID=UPI002FF5F02F
MLGLTQIIAETLILSYGNTLREAALRLHELPLQRLVWRKSYLRMRSLWMFPNFRNKRSLILPNEVRSPIIKSVS